MHLSRAEVIHDNFLQILRSGNWREAYKEQAPTEALEDPRELIAIFESQIVSRHLDRVAREQSRKNQVYYTIGSSGHEGMAAVAAALRPTDPALLHYRDAAFQIQRSKQVPGQTPLWDISLGFVASTDDPISGGRHKVLGNTALGILPQTSTIASHLPRAVGMAYGILLANRLGRPARMPRDAIVICSFGDASVNHSTAQGAINAALWAHYQKSPMPLLFVCEDNGIGISVRTPKGWIKNTLGCRPGLEYFSCDGSDLVNTLHTARQATAHCRKTRAPVILHMHCVRLLGHAGADHTPGYMTDSEISAWEQEDPVLRSAKILSAACVLSKQKILDLYAELESQVNQCVARAATRPKLASVEQIAESIVPPAVQCVETDSSALPKNRRTTSKQRPMSRLINTALDIAMQRHTNIVLAGEDIGVKGGVYNITTELQARFGKHRVIDTLLDEQSILGLALGMSQHDILPIIEIQFLAYLHNAEDQLRGEAATLSFFSNGQSANPMIVRVAGLGYQKGFGGHFHNDNSIAVLRDIPGLVIACPSNGHDAVLMLNECIRLAREERRVVVFLEPIALYNMRDLFENGDGKWLFPYPDANDRLNLGEVGQRGAGRDVAIVSYGNGYYLSCQAQKLLSLNHGIDTRCIDLRWLAPLNPTALLNAIKGCDAILIVDECRATGSQSEAIVTLLVESGTKAKAIRRVVGADTFIPLGPAATLPLPSRDEIVSAAINLVKDS